LVKNGAGTLNLTVTNSFTGGTTVNAGTLGLGSGSLGATPPSPQTNLTINNGTTVRYLVDGLTLSVNRGILLGTGGAIIDTQGFTADGIAGAISGTTFTKIGSGKLTLTNTASTYTGGVTVNAGTLNVN